MVERTRYEVDAATTGVIADKLRDVIEEIFQHIASAPRSDNISNVLEVSAENSEGPSEAVARMIRENSRVLGFDKSGFEDVEW